MRARGQPRVVPCREIIEHPLQHSHQPSRGAEPEISLIVFEQIGDVVAD
jgi:hypothetical protein